MVFGQPDSTPHPGTCSVGAELPQDFIRQDGGPTERGGRSNAVLSRFRLHRHAAEPSARGQIPRSFGQGCPWSRYLGMLCYSRMPRPPACEPSTMVTQCVRGMEVSPTVLAYQLSQVASSTPGPELPQRAPSRQGRSCLYGQHGDLCVYQPAMWLRSGCMSQLACHLLLWSQKHLRLLPAIHIPGVFNQAANDLSRAALPGEWRLPPQAVQLIGVSSEWLR